MGGNVLAETVYKGRVEQRLLRPVSEKASFLSWDYRDDELRNVDGWNSSG